MPVIPRSRQLYPAFAAAAGLVLCGPTPPPPPIKSRSSPAGSQTRPYTLNIGLLSATLLGQRVRGGSRAEPRVTRLDTHLATLDMLSPRVSALGDERLVA